MTPAEGEWVRANAWTRAMRKEGADWRTACACQYMPTTYCTTGQHDRCHRATPSPPSWEALICDKTGIYPVYHAEPNRYPTPSLTGPKRERVAQVWLADRMCRWRCGCSCHSAPARARYEIVELPGFEALAVR